MADDKPPSRAPWLDDVKRSRQLSIRFDDSLGKTGWDQVFRNAITEFNRLSVNCRLGVTFVQEQDAGKANVEAVAPRGNYELVYPPNTPKRIIQLDPAKPHGVCKPFMTVIQDQARIEQWRLMKAFIFVPAAPSGDRNGKPSIVGDPVKLVIAVHEMIHACGLVDDKEHSVDDIFSWPSLRMGNKPDEDRLATLGGTITFPGKPGEPPRVGHSMVEMPPLFLKKETADKVRNLWS